jgi:multisubunit Na+/H+ antiporter MnhE subunit
VRGVEGTVIAVLRRHPAGLEGGVRPPLKYLIAGAFVAFGVLLGVWIALVGQADLQDNIAGLVAAGVGVLIVWFVSVEGRAVPSFRRSDVGALFRLAPQLCRQTVGVYVATWRRARGYGPPGGVRTIATDVRGGGWPAARRSGLVGALLSFTPSTIVIDIDAETGVATVHDFVKMPTEDAD